MPHPWTQDARRRGHPAAAGRVPSASQDAPAQCPPSAEGSPSNNPEPGADLCWAASMFVCEVYHTIGMMPSAWHASVAQCRHLRRVLQRVQMWGMEGTRH